MSARYGVLFLLLAGLVALTAVQSRFGLTRLGLMWTATSLVLLSVCYFSGRSALLGKHVDGTRGLWSWWLHWPYFAISASGMHLVRWTQPGAAFVQVAPQLFLGRRLTAAQASRFRASLGRDPVAVLDLAAEFPATSAFARLSGYRSVPLLDATAPPINVLSETVDWLVRQTREGPVYVHCALGHGRSATFVTAYLLATEQASTVDDALHIVRERRIRVGPNTSQREVLRQYAARCRPLQ